ncbi:MAG: DUF547 domain-containing protein [Dokdonella sp.]
MRRLIALVFLLLASNGVSAATFDASHAAWNGLVESHVKWTSDGSASVVDYAGFESDRKKLQGYLSSASAVPEATFSRWAKADRIAFLINVYNAATVELVLTKYPDLKSIKDIGGLFGSPWKKDVLNLLGNERSLDGIEHDLIRGAADFDEPRIHFAVNCASIGCPALRPEAYVGSRLDSQLGDQANRFLRDRSRNHYAAGPGLKVSKIFDWYGKDFEAHAGGVNHFLAGHADALGLDKAATTKLESDDLPISYSDYDWKLNAE